MGIHIYSCLYSTIYVLLCSMFIEIFAERRILRKVWYRFGAMLGFGIAEYVLSVVLDDNMLFKQMAIIIVSTVCMRICYRQTYVKLAIFVLLYQGLGFIADYSAILLAARCLGEITKELYAEPLVFLLMVVLSQIFMLLFIMCLKRCIVKKSSDMLKVTEWLRFIVFPVFTIIIIMILMAVYGVPEGDNQKNALLGIAFGLLVMNLLVFYLINDILSREAKLRENQIVLERVKHETGMYRTISENYEKQRKREHEFKNQLTFIAALARENRVDEINHYLKEYNQEIMQNTDVIDTNNVIVNAILNSKYQEIRKKGILFVVKINDLSTLQIQDEDIVLILSNLLNNAIEAAEQCEDAVIKLKFVIEGEQIILSVINTFSREPVMSENKFLTTKTEDVDRHGIGLENIKDTVEKYDGSCVIRHDEKNFKVAILISNQQSRCV